jgi:quinol monooxygenase YgiN
MPSFLFHLQVKPECQAEALETLTAIQRAARQDEGCISFTWFRHEDDPTRFTMHERWVSTEALESHKAKGVDVWNAFVPCLVGEPVSEKLTQVGEILCGNLNESGTRDFVTEWYNKLSDRVAVEELLPMLAQIGLDMRFPGVVIRNAEQFRNWYAKVGEQFEEQEHILESLSQMPNDNGLTLFVTVVWKAKQKADGDRLAMRANQTWTIGRTAPDKPPVILTYEVNSLESLGA